MITLYKTLHLDFLLGQWLKLHASTAAGTCSTSDLWSGKFHRSCSMAKKKKKKPNQTKQKTMRETNIETLCKAVTEPTLLRG